MDYKYIEQLLERYWRCETSLQEEEILRMFFSQEDIPAALLPYRSLFVYEQNEKEMDVLGDDFDQRVLGLIQEDSYHSGCLKEWHKTVAHCYYTCLYWLVFLY